MSLGYQRRDRAVVDYRLFRAWEGGDWLRGPSPRDFAAGSYFACLGAAQTFGCLVREPWPELVGDSIGLPALNLGIAGAGPRCFLSPEFLSLANRARFVVVQVMSGRSADNPRMRTEGRERVRLDGAESPIAADLAWQRVLQNDLVGWRSPWLRGVLNRWNSTFGRAEVRSLVAQTQADWLDSYRELLASIRVPKLLLWFSRRSPSHRPRYHSVSALFGEYPQLVDARMLEVIEPLADRAARCVTMRGSPEPLRSSRDGSPVTVSPADAGTGEDPALRWTHNAYYPSSAMHEDAAAAVLRVLPASWTEAEAQAPTRIDTPLEAASENVDVSNTMAWNTNSKP
ncbi:MAG: DUF6473 family protein [Planctomycetota bacterium]